MLSTFHSGLTMVASDFTPAAYPGPKKAYGFNLNSNINYLNAASGNNFH